MAGGLLHTFELGAVSARLQARGVCGLRMLAAKNSRKRTRAWSWPTSGRFSARAARANAASKLQALGEFEIRRIVGRKSESVAQAQRRRPGLSVCAGINRSHE
jgi:hypothetical protein